MYGVEVGGFLCGYIWFFYWFHGMGILVSLGLRYRLLWFGSLGGLGGVGMVRKWKWYMLAI